jgi:hypothetical protein
METSKSPVLNSGLGAFNKVKAIWNKGLRLVSLSKSNLSTKVSYSVYCLLCNIYIANILLAPSGMGR